jgi:hypothetical protein
MAADSVDLASILNGLQATLNGAQRETGRFGEAADAFAALGATSASAEERN